MINSHLKKRYAQQQTNYNKWSDYFAAESVGSDPTKPKRRKLLVT